MRFRPLTVAFPFLLISAVAPENILDLQPFAKTETQGTTTLVNLNPAINAWYVLSVSRSGAPEFTYHLENANPHGSKLSLGAKGLVIAEGNNRHSCDLFDALEQRQRLAADLLPALRRTPVSAKSREGESYRAGSRDRVSARSGLGRREE